MLAKSWKKIGLIILIVACLWNIVTKFVYKVSFDSIINGVKYQIQTMQKK